MPCNSHFISAVLILDSLARRYPQLTFDLFADTFACPACSGYCNCSLCAPKRGEKYVPEREGGWRSWIAQQGGGSYLATVPAPLRTFAAQTKGSKNKTPAPVKGTPVPAPAKKRVSKTTTTPTAAKGNAPVLTRAGVRRLSSPSLVSPSAMRSYTAIRRTSCPSRNNPRSPFHLQHHHLLPARHPKQCKRKRKSTDMCLLGNRARRGAISYPFRIPRLTNTSKIRGKERRSCEGAVGAAGRSCNLSGASSRCY